MITKKELEKIAEQKGVSRSTIDKDWVLGHFIDSIMSISECRESLVFKGGTCLKKCYLPDYRFSEDLDFTAINPHFILNEDLLKKITGLVTERTEIPLHPEKLQPLRHKEMPTGYATVIKFWGADHPRNQAPPSPERWTSSIKIEIILYEKMIFTVQNKKVVHEYTDQLTKATHSIPCYALHEVLAEKLRALIQRSYTAPRDYYDIWHLSNNAKDLDWPLIVEAFYEKMKFKKLDFSGVEQLINDENDKKLKAAWKNSLGHQIPEEQLPGYEIVKKDLTDLFNKIFA